MAETATEDVLKTRKILKARRGTGAPPSTPTAGPQKLATAAANPFAGVNILGKLATAEQSSPSSTAAQVGNPKAFKGIRTVSGMQPQDAEHLATDGSRPKGFLGTPG